MGEGAGLGLSIAKSYIKALGGSIFAEAGTNGGTRIVFTIRT